MPDPRPRRILVVDLLGGLGDLVMVLPVVHALSRRYPHAELCVLTHPPGDALLRHDPAVTTVTRAVRGAERLAVVGALDRFRPDLVVSTTRYDGIAAEIEARGVRSVTDLWRNPPPDERVFERYQRILAAEGVIDDDIQHPRVVLTHAERVTGQRLLAEYVPSGSPVVVIPSAGMEVKDWPYWLALVRMIARRRDPPLIVGEPAVLRTWQHAPARPLPALELRALAGVFAAVATRGGVVVGPDTGPLRVAAAVGARTIGLFGPTLASRYGIGPSGVDLQGLSACPFRSPTAVTEQVCWWHAHCPLSAAGPACMAEISVTRVLEAIDDTLRGAVVYG